VLFESLQDLESEKVKNHLTILAKRLKKACLMISPPTFERAPKQILPFAELQAVVEKEHKKLLARKVLIERRKEEQERQMLEMVCFFTSLIRNWQDFCKVYWFFNLVLWRS